MDEFKLCFFEELKGDEGERCEWKFSHGFKSISFIVPSKSSDETFDKINEGKWTEILERDDFKEFLVTGEEKFDKNQKLGVSAACLLSYIQSNFTGPDLQESSDFRLQTITDERWKVDRISIDGIEINANMKHIELLIISRNFLEDLFTENPSELVR